jgi:hypothetical protein
MTSEFLELPIFSANYNDQVVFIEQFKTMLQNMNDEVRGNISRSVIVDSATTPNQSQWEAAWIAAGYALPIPPSAILTWWDTAANAVGGSFGTTPTSAGTVYSRDTLYPPGGTCYIGHENLSAAVSTNVSIGVTNTNHPYKDFVLPRRSDIFVAYELYTTLSSGTGSWGGDFLLDGVKVGTAYYGLPTNVGISQISQSGSLRVKARIPDVPAGSHRIQAIMGVILSPVSPPTIAYGGLTVLGLRKLDIRAVTL